MLTLTSFHTCFSAYLQVFAQMHQHRGTLICVPVYIYIYIYKYTHTHMHINRLIYIYIHIFINIVIIHTPMCHTHLPTHVRALHNITRHTLQCLALRCIATLPCIALCYTTDCIYTCMHAYMHTYTQTTHAYKGTLKCIHEVHSSIHVQERSYEGGV